MKRAVPTPRFSVVGLAEGVIRWRGLAAVATPRNDLVQVFATGVPGLNQPAGVSPGEMLRLNLAIPSAAKPNRFGVLAGDLAGFPNGRRLADDVVDIELRVVAGVLVEGFNIAPNNQLGDGIDANDVPYLPYFPYVAPPHNPRNHEHHDLQHGPSPNSVIGSVGTAAGSLAMASSNPGRQPILSYSLAKRGRVTLKVYDIQGRLIRTLIDQDAAAGDFRATWDGKTDSGEAVGNGVYMARLTSDGATVDSRKVVIR